MSDLVVIQDVGSTVEITTDVGQLISTEGSSGAVTVTDGSAIIEISDVGMQGPPGTGGTGSSFAPTPELIDDATSTTVFYFGWESLNGGWLVREMQTATSAKLNASTSNNPSYSNLAEAWPNRASLTYA